MHPSLHYENHENQLGIVGGTTIGLPPVYHHGSEELKQRVMPPCVKGEKVGGGFRIRGVLVSISTHAAFEKGSYQHIYLGSTHE